MTVTAYVLLNVEFGQEEKVLTEIAQLKQPDIKTARASYGLHDIVLKIESETQAELNAIIHMIRKLLNIHSSITLVTIPDMGGFG